ncbi:hydroxymethylglutaryl-CoA lyase [Altericroceibacterium endophyticum]|uniref:Hydroxymethylglutaryl-CoA lyase n=1 Tax=Altericroceibacterium endophyticum TaxID=1808508 RepID=A0A6I4T5Z8_9SPHN|nr:hydroxymethylglutaryl-CoA lyase [Altericroceibacterium endophyticum]MXO66326.1 hydroxymethylglutaryl-CoA lyase [Altericroceibacterium endophyticum]
MTMPSTIEIVEVSPRDGLQNEARLLSTEDKLALIHKAVDAGVRRIEVASFVHPKRVPQMADAEAVCAGLPKNSEAIWVGLALNRRGVERALATQINEIGAVVCASDGFASANQGCSAEQTIEDAIEIITMARAAGRRAQATISVAFGCPFDGEIAIDRVADIARRLAAAHPHEIALGDTIGVATPRHVQQLMAAVRSAAPAIPLRMHFHDTRNSAIANAWVALEAGAATLDSSIGGSGGCPFAPGASGNVATEDLLYMLGRSGIASGIDLSNIISAAHWLSERLDRQLPGSLGRAAPFPSL